jgi:hypothetical protein
VKLGDSAIKIEMGWRLFATVAKSSPSAMCPAQICLFMKAYLDNKQARYCRAGLSINARQDAATNRFGDKV